MNHAQKSAPRSFDAHGLTIGEGSLGIGGAHILLSKISSVACTVKRLPTWPGIALGVWAAGVFINDMMPQARGVEPNSPMFKFAILLAAVAWFTVRMKVPPSYVVMISADAEAVQVARCQTEAEANEIVNTIRDAARG